jgi:serine/threonine protein kinase
LLIDSNGRLKLTDFGLSEDGVKAVKRRHAKKRKTSITSGSGGAIQIEKEKTKLEKDIENVLGLDKSNLLKRKESDDGSPTAKHK